MSAHGTEPNTEPLLFPDPVIEAYIKDVDRSLIRENLRQPVERRFSWFAGTMRSFWELKAAMARSNGTSR